MLKKLRSRLSVAVIFALIFSTAAAAQDARSQTVRFAVGTTSVSLSDAITGYESVDYHLGAESGQILRVELSASNLATYFNIYAPGRRPGDEALAVGQNTNPINEYEGVLGASGEYIISVYMMRSAARRGERSDFTLNVAIDGKSNDAVEGDFADGLAGGPDFLQAATSGGGTLNIRKRPSSGAQIVTRLSNGQNVRNLGCRMSEGRRWCHVATLADPGYEGWAAGDFLIEGSETISQLPQKPPSTQTGAGQTSEERIRFAAGTSGTEIRASLAPGASRRYVLGAQNGQFLYVRVAAQGPNISYQIFNPDRTFLLDQMTSEKEYRGQLWQSGDHVVEVINRGNAPQSYNLIVGIE